MSDTANTDSAGTTAPLYNIRIADPKDLEHYSYFSTEDWRHDLANRLREVTHDLRGVRFAWFVVLACVLLVVRHVLDSSAKGQPGWLIVICMLLLTGWTGLAFRSLMKPLRQFGSPVKIARFFEITYKAKGGKTHYANEAIAEVALRDLFGLNPATKKNGKAKKNAVDPYPGVVSTSEAAAKFRRTGWTAINIMLLALIVTNGPVLNVVFAAALLIAFIAVARYRNLALQPVHKLIDTDSRTDTLADQAKDEETDEDAPDITDGIPADLSEEDKLLLIMVRKHHAGDSMTLMEQNYLRGIFPKNFPHGVPTAKKLLKDMQSTPKDDTVTASADDSASPEDTAVLPVPLPAPVPMAPVPNPVPAPSTPTYSPDELDKIYVRHMNGERISPEELAAIQPWLTKED